MVGTLLPNCVSPHHPASRAGLSRGSSNPFSASFSDKPRVGGLSTPSPCVGDPGRPLRRRQLRPREGRRILPADRQDGPAGRLQAQAPRERQGGCPRASPRNPHLLCSRGILFCDVESTFLIQCPMLIHQPGHLTLSCPSLNTLSQRPPTAIH